MPARLARYRKSDTHSYAFGVQATLEALARRPGCVRQVLLLEPDKGGEGVERVLRLCDRHGIAVEVAPKTIARIARREFPAVAVFEKQDRPVDGRTNHLVLHRPQYEGNVGTIIRTMVGFGLADLVLLGEGVDVLGPETVRASMGAVFDIRVSQFDDLDAYRRCHGDHRLYLFMGDGQTPLPELAPVEPFALVFGREADGLPDSARALGTTVRIDHAGTIDSLNLAVAVGIALHAVTRPPL